MPSLTFDSPIGPLHAVADETRLLCVGFGPGSGSDDPNTLLDRTAAWFAAYFDGRDEPVDLPLAPAGSPFQAQVRAAMLAIPFGGTRTYGEIARDIGGSPRAVGQACGRNPIPILVPCHRVLGAGGAIGGFSGGNGPPTKQRLLAHEAHHAFVLTP